jgi:hypothetical protein
MAHQYYSFEKVLNELHLAEDELKRMVSEGQLRAFRDNNKMRFRKEDVERLRSQKQEDPTLVLGGDDLSDDTDDTLNDAGDLDDLDFQTDDSSVPSLDFDGDEAGDIEYDDVPDVELDDLGSDATQRIADDADFLDGDDLDMQTEPLDLDMDDADATMIDPGTAAEAGGLTAAGDDEDVDLHLDGEATMVDPGALRPAQSRARRAAAGAGAPSGGGGATGQVGVIGVLVLIVGLAVLALPAFVVFDYSSGTMSAPTEPVAKFGADLLLKDQDDFNARNYTPTERVNVPDWAVNDIIDAPEPVQ